MSTTEQSSGHQGRPQTFPSMFQNAEDIPTPQPLNHLEMGADESSPEMTKMEFPARQFLL